MIITICCSMSQIGLAKHIQTDLSYYGGCVLIPLEFHSECKPQQAYLSRIHHEKIRVSDLVIGIEKPTDSSISELGRSTYEELRLAHKLGKKVVIIGYEKHKIDLNSIIKQIMEEQK